MPVHVIPIQLNLTETKEILDGGGSTFTERRLCETDIAADLQEQLNRDVPEGASLVALLPASTKSKSLKYLAIYEVPASKGESHGS